MNSAQKLWRRLVTAMTGAPHPNPFPVANGNMLNFSLLARFETELLKSFPLEGCQILHKDGGPHWALLFHFTCDGMHYGLRADRSPEPTPPSNASSLPSHDASTLSSGAFENKRVCDLVTGHTPPLNTWPDGPPAGYTVICSLDLPDPHLITLLDVSLILSLTHEYRTSYKLIGYNCRWLAKTIGLALEQLAHRHHNQPEWQRQKQLFFTKTESIDFVKKRRVEKALSFVISGYVKEVSLGSSPQNPG
jgi:hypothetical protein